MDKNIEIKRIQAEETWSIRHRVMWSHQPFDFVKLPEDQNGEHYGLFVDGTLTSIVSVFVNGDDFQFRKLATETEQQGKGYGSKLLAHILNLAVSRKAKRFWCNARLEKAYYYEKFGMKTTDRRYSKGGIDFVIMEKTMLS